MTCPSCGKDRVVFVTNWIVWGRRRIEWTQCSECEVMEMNEWRHTSLLETEKR